jgi:ABC-type branched-subunit amino acid transport system ATPase component
MMRSIAGLTPARSGSIQVFGTEAAKLAPYQVSRLRRLCRGRMARLL